MIRVEMEIPGKMIAERVKAAAGQVGARRAAWVRGEEPSWSLGCPGTPALGFVGYDL